MVNAKQQQYIACIATVSGDNNSLNLSQVKITLRSCCNLLISTMNDSCSINMSNFAFSWILYMYLFEVMLE